MMQLPMTAEELCACFDLHPDHFTPAPDNEGWAYLPNQWNASKKHTYAWRLYQSKDALTLMLHSDVKGKISFTAEVERFSFDMEIPINADELHTESVWSSNFMEALAQAEDVIGRSSGKRVKGERMTTILDDMIWFLHELDHLITLDDFPEDTEDGLDELVFIDENH